MHFLEEHCCCGGSNKALIPNQSFPCACGHQWCSTVSSPLNRALSLLQLNQAPLWGKGESCTSIMTEPRLKENHPLSFHHPLFNPFFQKSEPSDKLTQRIYTHPSFKGFEASDLFAIFHSSPRIPLCQSAVGGFSSHPLAPRITTHETH